MANDPNMNPYPGLRSFEGDEDYLFFGREDQTDALLKKLSHDRFLAVIGTSGSGKSSLVKSGLLPFLYSGYMATAGSGWKVALSRPGDDPIGNLARSLAIPDVLYEDEDGSMESTYAAIIESTLRRSSVGLADAIKQSQISKHENLLIVIDQFEELFRFNRYERKSKEGKRDSLHFVSLLLKACKQRDVPIYVVITMRSDFLGECTQFRGLPEAINEGQYLIPRMTRDERKAAITGPAAVSGTSITNRLLNRLLNDVGDNPDQLPILQHALMRLWSYWNVHHDEGEPIDLEHYEAIGTMERALSLHAEEAFAKLSTERERTLCEILFKSLTDKGANGQGIRRPCRLSEICAIANADIDELKPIIEIFRKPGISFLMPPSSIELEEDTIIDISHESLMRVWTRLIEWVEDETQSAEIYLRLSEAAALYHEGKAGLWSGPELQLTLNWREYSSINESWAKRYDSSYERAFLFLDYSKDAYEAGIAEKERRRKAVLRNTRRFTAILGISLLVSILIAIKALELKEKAVEKENAANVAKRRAQESDSLTQLAILEAESNKLKALEARDAAQYSDSLTQIAILEADSAKQNAVMAREEALRQKDTAKRLFQFADSMRGISQKNFERAESLRKSSDSMSLWQLGKALALQAVRVDKTSTANVSQNLAYLAYKFTTENGGDPHDPSVVNALLYASGSEDGVEYKGHSDGVRAATIFDGGRKIITGGDDGVLNIWETNTTQKNPSSNITVKGSNPSNLRSVKVTKDGQFVIYGTSGGSVMASRIDGSGEPSVLHKGNKGVTSIDFDPESGRIVGSTIDGKLFIWNSMDSSSKSVLADTRVRINAVKFAPDRSRVALAMQDGEIRVYSLTGDSLGVYPVGNPVFSLAYSRDGKWMAAGTGAGKLLIWDLGSTNIYPTQSTNAHYSGVNDLVFSHDSRSLATAGSDRLTKVWEFHDLKKEPLVLRGHESYVWDVEFALDGKHVFSTGSDKTLRSWNIDGAQLYKDLCSKITRPFGKEDWNSYVGEGVKYQKICDQ